MSEFVYLCVSECVWMSVSLLPRGRASLRPPSMVLDLINSPDGTLDVLHAHEALVEGQIVPNGVLLSHSPIQKTPRTQTNKQTNAQTNEFCSCSSSGSSSSSRRGLMKKRKKEKRNAVACLDCPLSLTAMRVLHYVFFYVRLSDFTVLSMSDM